MSWPERGWWYTLCEERDTVTKKVLEVLEKTEKDARERLLKDAVTALFEHKYLMNVGDGTYPADEIQTLERLHKMIRLYVIPRGKKLWLRGIHVDFSICSTMLSAGALYQACRKHIPTKVEIVEDGRKWSVVRTFDETSIMIDIHLESLHAQE